MSVCRSRPDIAVSSRHFREVTTAEVRVRAILLQMLLIPTGTQSATPAHMANG